MRFSERYKYKSVREIVQIESMNEPLRNALWSLLKLHIWDDFRASTGLYDGYSLCNELNRELKSLCEWLWFDYFKYPLDTLNSDWSKVLSQLRVYFFKCEWYEAYDFIEYCANHYKRPRSQGVFFKSCNSTFEKEMSAYRFIDGLVTQITEQEQLEEIDKALDEVRGPVRTHLRRSLELLSNRESPDYRNSIKESICAVESLVSIVLGSKGTLGQLIKKLEDKVEFHSALKTAFSSLYGYTSDEGGIRHALLDAESIQFEDAKVFSCGLLIFY